MPIMSHASAGEASVGSAELTEPAEFLECCMHCYMGYEEPACSDWHGTAQVRPGQQTPACCRLLQTYRLCKGEVSSGYYVSCFCR